MSDARKRTNYPDPHPFKVLRLSARTSWNSRGQPIPTIVEYRAYQGREVAEAEYEAWRRNVEAAKRANDAKGPPPAITPASTATEHVDQPAPPAATPASSATRFDCLPHRRARPEQARMEVMSVRVREGINARLDAYRARHRVSKQEVVSDVLDAFLVDQGF